MGGAGLGAKSTGKLDSPFADIDRSQTWNAGWMGGSGLGAKSGGKRGSSLGTGASPAARGQDEKLTASPADFAQRATGLFASLDEPLSKPVLDSPIADIRLEGGVLITPASDAPSWVVTAGAVGEGGIPTGSKRVRRTKAVERDKDGVSDPGADLDDQEEDEDAEDRWHLSAPPQDNHRALNIGLQ